MHMYSTFEDNNSLSNSHNYPFHSDERRDNYQQNSFYRTPLRSSQMSSFQTEHPQLNETNNLNNNDEIYNSGNNNYLNNNENTNNDHNMFHYYYYYPNAQDMSYNNLSYNNQNANNLLLGNIYYNILQVIENIVLTHTENTQTNITPTQQNIDDATNIVNYKDIVFPANDTCPISLERFKENERVIQICNCEHIFHIEPLYNWFNRNSTCPVCRYDIRQSNNDGERGHN